jgi:hypothetical protein
MPKTLFEKIDNLPISDNSKYVYKNHLKKLNNNIEPLKANYLKNKKKIVSKLEELSTPTQINYLSSIMVVLKKDSEIYNFYHNRKGDLMIKREKELSENTKERKYNDNIDDEISKLLHEIARYIPRRILDFYLLKFYEGGEINPNFNYLAKKNGKFILMFNNYKTSSTYESQIFDFPVQVVPLLESFLKKPYVQNSDFVFGKIENNKITSYENSNGLSQKFKRDTGLTMNDMRHLYAIKHCKGLSDQLDEHLMKLAHSYNTNKYYQKT